MKRLFLSLAFLFAPSLVFAQSGVLQGGAWTAGHAPMYVGAGSAQTVVQDSGPAGGGGAGIGLSELLLAARGTGNAPYSGQGTGPFGTNACDYDAPTNNATGYHFFCFSANANGSQGMMAFGAAGGAATIPFVFNVNGTNYTFPFTTGGIVGPGTTVVNDAACWNNLVGTLLADCGAFVTVGGTNTWTGTNNFTGTFKWSSVTQTFPGSGIIVGTTDIQTLTNKSINASEVNSGTLPCGQFPSLTGNVTTVGCAATIPNSQIVNAMFANLNANTVKGNGTGSAAAPTDLAMPSCSTATSALQWTSGTGFGCQAITAASAGWGLALSTGVMSVSTTQPPYGYVVPVNLGLTASVGSSALTITMTGANGSAPSATNPVSIPFRSATLTSGAPVWTAITASQTITIPSGGTLGTANSTPFRIWIFEEYNAGTPELVVATCSSTTQVFPCAGWENTKTTTTSINASSTAAGTPYSTTGVSSDLIRIIGFCDYASGLATAGSWASACTTLQVFGPGVKKPGDTVQTVSGSSSSPTTGSGTTYEPTVPAVSITPSTSSNLIVVTASGTLEQSGSSSDYPLAGLYRASGGSAACTTAIGSLQLVGIGGASTIGPVAPQAFDAPGSASQQTYTVCVKELTSGNPVYCPSGSATLTCTIQATEIMGKRDDEPVNDNINPGIFALTG